MGLTDIALALFITVIWGVNFSVVKIGLASFDPYLLAAIRFALCAIPIFLFIPKPKVAWRFLIAYGLVFGVFLWGLVYAGIHAGLSAGLASLVLQCAAFFTILFGAVFFKEKIGIHQIAGILTAFCGVGLIFFITDGSTSLVGILLVLFGAAAWGVANLIVKKAATSEMFGFVVWSSFFSPLPLLFASLYLNGSEKVVSTLIHIDRVAIFSILFQVYPTTLLGYSVWNYLIKKYPMSSVAPISLFVPVFGMLGSVIIFGEDLGQYKIAAMVLIILGLLINLFGKKLLNGIHTWRT